MYVKANGSELVKFPYTLQELKADNPNVSFPKSYPSSTLESYNVYQVLSVDIPEFDNLTQTIESSDVFYDNGWKRGWNIIDLTESQIAAKARAATAAQDV